MNMNLLRKQIRIIIFENLDGRSIKDSLFNYYTTKSECEKGFFGQIPVKKYGDKVIDDLIQIIMEEEGISEKSFSLVDEAVEKAKQLALNNENALNIIKDCSENTNRTNLCAEKIYALLQ